MLFENSDLLFPNGTCLLVSLQADEWANIQCTWWPDMLLGMLWYYRTEVQDGHAYCPSVWLLWDTAQTSTFFFLLAILIWSQHLEKKMFRDSWHITVVPLSLLDDVLLGCSSSLLTFCFHRLSSQELQGSLKAFLFVVMEVFLLCTDCCDVADFPCTSLPWWYGRGYTSAGELTCQTLERSLLSSPVPMPKLAEWLESNTWKLLLGLKWSHDEKLKFSDGTKGHVQAWIKGHAITRISYRGVPVLSMAKQSMRLEKLVSCY